MYTHGSNFILEFLYLRFSNTDNSLCNLFGIIITFSAAAFLTVMYLFKFLFTLQHSLNRYKNKMIVSMSFVSSFKV